MLNILNIYKIMTFVFISGALHIVHGFKFRLFPGNMS